MLQKTRTVFFYAPLKSPHHSIPSGDRAVARMLISLLKTIGFKVIIISDFRSFYKGRDPLQLKAIETEGRKIAKDLIQTYKKKAKEDLPHLWFTYHLYYKAPDYLGPAFCRAFDIPYALAEASIANKRAEGLWKIGHGLSVESVILADYLFSFGKHDIAGIHPLLKKGSKHYLIPPFLDASDFKLSHTRPLGKKLRFLTVAMMREGDKLSSYRMLAKLLQKFKGQAWRLTIVGNGEAEDKVHHSFLKAYAFSKEQIHFKGALEGEALKHLYQTHDLMLWPAINEAYGMAFLEAHFSALPVMAGDYGSVSSIVEGGRTGFLFKAGEFETFQMKLGAIIQNPKLLKNMGHQARLKAIQEHSAKKVAAIFSKAFMSIFE